MPNDCLTSPSWNDWLPNANIQPIQSVLFTFRKHKGVPNGAFLSTAPTPPSYGLRAWTPTSHVTHANAPLIRTRAMPPTPNLVIGPNIPTGVRKVPTCPYIQSLYTVPMLLLV